MLNLVDIMGFVFLLLNSNHLNHWGQFLRIAGFLLICGDEISWIPQFSVSVRKAFFKICFQQGCKFLGDLGPPMNTVKIETPQVLMIP